MSTEPHGEPGPLGEAPVRERRAKSTDRRALTLRTLLTDPARRVALGNGARERAAERFSIDSMTDAYERLYRGA